MKIDTTILDARFRKYMTVPGSRATWNELTNTVLFNVTASLCLAVVALILICTVIMAWTGIKMLYGIIRSFVTLEVFRDPRQEYLDHPERMRALVLCMVISSRKGYSIMLGTLSDDTQADAPFLARKAAELAAFYVDESGDGEGELFDLMRDDRFQFFRRRAVPASHSEGRDLILFDVDYDLEEVHYTDRRVAWAAVVITIDEAGTTATDADPDAPPKGRLVQIPWRVVQPAIVE